MSPDTTIHDPLPIDHYVTHAYVARCSCGWSSGNYPTELEAVAILTAHRVTREHFAFHSHAY